MLMGMGPRFWLVFGLGYIIHTGNTFDLHVWEVSSAPKTKPSGKYNTLEAAQAAAELIYSTRSES